MSKQPGNPTDLQEKRGKNPKTVRKVKAWAIQRKSDDDISNRLFETRKEAVQAWIQIPFLSYRVIQVEIRPVRPTKNRRKR